MKFEKHINIESADKSLVDVLYDTTALSKQAIKQAMNKGAVWLSRKESTQRVRRVGKVLQHGDCVHIYYDQSVLEKKVEDAILISDENDYSIWFKPYGMLSQGSKWGDHCTINRWVEKNLQPQRSAFIVHRLDRAASGLMIIAHKKNTAAYLADLFQRRQVEKKYQAIVHGKIADVLDINIPIDDKPAISHIRPVKYDERLNQSHVEVAIETGRKHQIRRHLSESGFPIVGDRLYGDEGDLKDLCLTSCYISFISPLDEEKKVYVLDKSRCPEL